MFLETDSQRGAVRAATVLSSRGFPHGLPSVISWHKSGQLGKRFHLGLFILQVSEDLIYKSAINRPARKLFYLTTV